MNLFKGMRERFNDVLDFAIKTAKPEKSEIEIQAELMAALAEEITAEIDKEILEAIRNLPGV